jgi:hypothetical protein
MIISFHIHSGKSLAKAPILALILLAVCARSYGQKDSIAPKNASGGKDSIDLQISWLRKGPVVNAQKDSDLVLKIILSSQCARQIKVQNRQIFFVRTMDIPGGDAFIEVRTTTASGADSTVETINQSDQLLLNLPPPPATLSKGQSITYYFDLINYYNLTPHHTYRVRIGYELSSFNKDLPDVYSDWLTFEA